MKRCDTLKAFATVLVLLMAAGAGNQARAAEPYKIGYITDLSGPLAGSYTPTWEGFELYIKTVNDRGGVNGHPVEVLLDDDGLKADRAVAHAKKLAERDKVLAIFGLSLSSTQGPVYAEMRKVGVPVVTTFSGILDALPPAKPYSYSLGVVFEVAGEVIGDFIPEIVPGGKVVGITIDSVGGRAAIRHNQAVVRASGYTWGEVIFPVRTTDFTPHAQAVVDRKPDLVVGHYGAGQNLGIIPALRKVGYDGPYVVAVYGVGEDTVKLAAEKAGGGRNLYTVSRYVSVFEENPGLERVRAAANKYGTEKAFSTMHVHGWVLGKFATTALEKCGWPCTREQLNSVMETLKIDTEGLTGGPVEMAPDDHYGPTYWRLYRWEEVDQKLVPVGKWLRKESLTYKP
ncbi:MAG: ABC transporter substrate-binding protein [Gammaproteobacteria bacterium]|nr:ABC transporter substrate-binding protein [Gammaproteobacteria bacterium]NIR85916.1 ABC transporter substrate-binding protein [Gammaproteobacteria bacterium]NIR91908.1 ABC transporter substrate-binding protein [Gammaproteobacteria bacterium]NIU07165.1 ABC transporter substrate-binding protein [Gammaproteobacteria bacterium]NIV53978.1 ABC transporter substrate-binding protein [Gammaproteobacteria bacterium]